MRAKEKTILHYTTRNLIQWDISMARYIPKLSPSLTLARFYIHIHPQ